MIEIVGIISEFFEEERSAFLVDGRPVAIELLFFDGLCSLLGFTVKLEREVVWVRNVCVFLIDPPHACYINKLNKLSRTLIENMIK